MHPRGAPRCRESGPGRPLAARAADPETNLQAATRRARGAPGSSTITSGGAGSPLRREGDTVRIYFHLNGPDVVIRDDEGVEVGGTREARIQARLAIEEL